jgi:nitroreductase
VLYDKGKTWELSRIVVDWMRGLIASGSSLAESFRMKNIVAAWDNNNDWVCREAPHLFVAYALKDDPIAAQDCTIALTYLELAAASLGLGACWAGYAAMAINMCPEARKFVGISSRAQCYGAMLVGYAKINYYRIPQRNKARVKWS